MANENYDPTTRHIGKKEGKSKFRYHFDGAKVIHPMRMAKEKADRIKANPKRPTASAILPHIQSLPMPVGVTKSRLVLIP